MPDLMAAGEQIESYVCDTSLLLHNALKENKKILVEGQLGALRDPDHGIYPYPTSSSTLAGFCVDWGGYSALFDYASCRCCKGVFFLRGGGAFYF